MDERITLDQPENKFEMSGLKLAFYGLLFTAINIRIQGFDIVPDVIGYIMIAVGMARIEHYDDHFRMVKNLSYLLAVLALINIYQAPVQNTVDQMDMMETATNSVNFSAGLFGQITWLATAMMIAAMAITVYFAYSLCMGLKNLLNQVGDVTLAGVCEDRWKLILGAEVGLLVSITLVLLAVPFGTVMTMIFGVLALVALVLFLLLVNNAYKSIEGKEISGSILGKEIEE